MRLFPFSQPSLTRRIPQFAAVSARANLYKGASMNARLLTIASMGLTLFTCGTVGAADARVDVGALPMGATFPEFNETDVEGKPVSLASYKGKIVLVDFWATWCGPCVAELPNVLKAYEKYHSKGFEIIGISLDQDKDKLTTFIKSKNMPWQQFFDGQGWKNKLAQQYGIRSIPATYLIGKDGKLIGKNYRGGALEQALAKELGK
jgi:peroxiredoxin